MPLNAQTIKSLLLRLDLSGVSGEGFAPGLDALREALGLSWARLTITGERGRVALVLTRPAGLEPPEGVALLRLSCGPGAPPLAFLEAAPGETPLDADAGALLDLAADRIGLLLHAAALEETVTAAALDANALAAVSREMTWGSDIEVLLNLILHEAVKISRSDGGALYLRDPGSDTLFLQSALGSGRTGARETVSLGYGIVGWVAKNATPLRADDRGESAAHLPAHRNHLAVPLIDEGAVTGVLALESTGAAPFTDTHERILSVFAAQASKAIAAARLIRALRSERDLLDNILGGSPNGVVAVDDHRRVVLMNLAAQRMLAPHETPAEAHGKPVERYLPQDAFQEALSRVLGRETELESLDFTLGHDLEPRHYHGKLFRLRRGDERGATLILQDVTAQKKLDENVQRMGRMASIGQLAAGVAHEIRNPLTGIGITLENLREDGGLSEEGREMVADVVREIDRLEALIRGLLDFARPQPAKRRPMRVAKALEWHRTFVEQCRKKGVACEVDLSENPKIMGDPERLKQMFLNLAINALDATEPGGEVALRCLVADSRHALVEVSDTGRGMDAATQARIFDPFFTTKNEGTGLGLSIAHSIAEQHGGGIDVVSAPGRGTRFRVTLPLFEA